MHLPRNTRGRQTQTHTQMEAGEERGRGRVKGKRWGGWVGSGGGVRGYHIYCSYRTAKAKARQLVQKFIETWNIVRTLLTVLVWASPSLIWVTSSPWTETIGSTSSSLLLMSTFQVKVQITCMCAFVGDYVVNSVMDLKSSGDIRLELGQGQGLSVLNTPRNKKVHLFINTSKQTQTRPFDTNV